MRLIYSKINGYIRLAYAGVKTLEYTPQEKIQLILGTNGCGKSSLIKELSPLPANHQEYIKGGYKQDIWTHGSSTYKLSSSFTETGNEYSFVKDDVELNTGKTLTVFRDLVKSEFGLTTDIHEMMLGVDTRLFTNMSSPERRAWFTRLSGADYAYAIGFYQRIKERHRDLVGARKQISIRLSAEYQKLITPEHVVCYREQIDSFKKQIQKLIEARPQDTRDANKKSQNTQLLQSLTKSVRFYLGEIGRLTGGMLGYGKTPADIQAKLYYLQDQLSATNDEIKRLGSQIEDLDEAARTLEDNNLSSFKDIDAALDARLTQIAQLRSTLYLKDFDPPEPSACLRTHKPLCEAASTLLADIYPNPQMSRYTLSRLQASIEGNRRLDDHAVSLNKLVLEKAHQLDHIRRTKENNRTQCPQCNHVWHRGYSEQEESVVTRELKDAQDRLSAVMEQRKENTLYVDEATSYFSAMRSFERLRVAYPGFDGFWKLLDKTDLLLENPKEIINWFNNLAIDLATHIEIASAKSHLNHLAKMRADISGTADVSLQKLKNTRDEKEGLLHDTQIKKIKLVKEIQTHQGLLKTMDSLSKTTDLLEAALLTNDQIVNAEILALKRQCVNEAISILQGEVTRLEDIVSRANIQQSLVENLEEQRDSMAQEQELLGYALKELSPTEGLIARNMCGFINHLLDQMNTEIAGIWLYPMSIDPIEVGDVVDLDYRFKLRIDESIVVSDISKASAGMKELINLAFRVVAPAYLGITEAALHLDEFGARLDPAHRRAAHRAIEQLSEDPRFSQIFVISHYEQNHSAIAVCDINVLSASHLDLPKEMQSNKVMKFL